MKTNTYIILAVTFLLGVGAYWYFFTNTGNDTPLTVTQDASIAQQQFESLVGRLPTSFDTSIFSDKRFSVLVDITQPIQDEAIGRYDPLAPIPGVTGL